MGGGAAIDERMPKTSLKVSAADSPSNPAGVTGELCNWIQSTALSDIPEEVQTRAKYLILDGIACGIVGSHLPWSETAAKAIFNMEPDGDSTVIGWGIQRLPPLSAALLKSTFIQGFELDAYHSVAPIHSSSILLPALFSASSKSRKPSLGSDLLLSFIIGCEVGPRIGLALHGQDLVTRGWHSGAVQGPSAAAAAVSNFLKLPPNEIESALGIACTQAAGLMSAQFGSMAKRMQHGFASGNGLFATLMAQGGYTGIEEVYEVPYGGFLSCFGQGSYLGLPLLEQIVKGLGTIWELQRIGVKLHAAVCFVHGTIDCVQNLQKIHPHKMRDLDHIFHIEVECAAPAYGHSGWIAGEYESLTATSAQMSIQDVTAVQLVDGVVLMTQFSEDKLQRSILRELMTKVHPVHNPEFDISESTELRTRVTMTFDDGTVYVEDVLAPNGINPPVSNEEIVDKWRHLVEEVLDEKRRDEIEKCVLELEKLDDIGKLLELLAPIVPSPI